MAKLKKTLLVGGLMGAGLVWLTSTKKGKETRDKMFEAAADIYIDVSKKWKKLETKYQSSKTVYVKMVNEAVADALKKYPALSVAKDIVTKMVLAQWDELSGQVKESAQETKKAAKAAMKKASPSRRARKSS